MAAGTVLAACLLVSRCVTSTACYRVDGPANCGIKSPRRLAPRRLRHALADFQHASKIIFSFISLGRHFLAGRLSLCEIVSRRVDTEYVARDRCRDTPRRLAATRAVTSRRCESGISVRHPHVTVSEISDTDSKRIALFSGNLRRTNRVWGNEINICGVTCVADNRIIVNETK